jgi:hypothetical protein
MPVARIYWYFVFYTVGSMPMARIYWYFAFYWKKKIYRATPTRRLLANSLEEAAEVEASRGHLSALDGEPPLLESGAHIVFVVNCNAHRDSASRGWGLGVYQGMMVLRRYITL